MGPSGAGKSSLLHVLGMHDHAWSGEYFFDDDPIHTLKPKERSTLRNEKIGFVFQNYHLHQPDAVDTRVGIGGESRAGFVASS